MAPPHTSAPVVVGPPLYAGLVPFAAVPFTLVLLSDIAYWRTSNLLWLHGSEWLLLVGAVMGGLAIFVALVEMLFRRAIRPLMPGAASIILFVSAYVVAIVNNFVHARDGWNAVVFLGLGLSAATVVLLILSALFRRAPIHRRHLGAVHA